MQATSQVNRSSRYSNHNDELDSSTVSMTTLNARVVCSIKHPKSSFLLSYPAVMIIFDINKQDLSHGNNDGKVSYTPSILHLEPKYPYLLPKAKYDKPIALIESLYPAYKKDCDGKLLSYTIKSIKIAFEGINFEPIPEERFIVANPNADLLIYDYGNPSAPENESQGKFIRPLRDKSPFEESKKMPLIWRLKPEHKIVLTNHKLADQIFHIVTINERTAKL